MQLSSSLSLPLPTLAAKMGVGEKKQPLPPMPPLLPTRGRDTAEIEDFHRRRPACDLYVDRATCDGSTDARGQCQGRSPVDEDNDDNGDNKDNGGGAAKMSDEVGDEFEAPLKTDEAKFGPTEVAVSPLLGSGLARGWGSWNTNNRAGRSSRS
jgi:hypothetical protein